MRARAPSPRRAQIARERGVFASIALARCSSGLRIGGGGRRCTAGRTVTRELAATALFALLETTGADSFRAGGGNEPKPALRRVVEWLFEVAAFEPAGVLGGSNARAAPREVGLREAPPRGAVVRCDWLRGNWLRGNWLRGVLLRGA